MEDTKNPNVSSLKVISDDPNISVFHSENVSDTLQGELDGRDDDKKRKLGKDDDLNEEKDEEKEEKHRKKKKKVFLLIKVQQLLIF
jgi:hypothetical protein